MYTLTEPFSFQLQATITLKSYSNELFLFQLTNDLCTSIIKIVIILFLNKAVFIEKRTLLFQYFMLKQNDHRGTILKFLEFVCLYHSQQCHHARGKLFLTCIRSIV